MNKHVIMTLIGTALLAPLLAGCAAPAATEPAPPQQVVIALTDFTVETSTTEFRVGQTYEFVITNNGAINHEFRLIPTSSGHGGHTDEEHATALLVVEEEDLEPGETITVEYTFTDEELGSEIEIACHIAGHYEAGMKLPITVVN